MASCAYSKFCGKRMAHGDRANGCSDVDQRTCDPAVYIRYPTKTAAPQPPFRKCCACPRTITQQQWEATRRPPLCMCGMSSWMPI